MLRFALYGFALLCSWEREAVTRYGLFCVALLCFARARGELSHVTVCIALLRFALHCFALHCIALLVCGMSKKMIKNMLIIRHAESKPKAC